MSTTIPCEFEQFVAQAIASGRFRSEEEAATGAFDLLQRREQKLNALRAEIQIGLDDISAGRMFPLDLDDMKHHHQR